jgi:transposase
VTACCGRIVTIRSRLLLPGMVHGLLCARSGSSGVRADDSWQNLPATKPPVLTEPQMFWGRRAFVSRGSGRARCNKNDYIDAEAIAEAVGRPRMRFVPIKTDDQLDLQSLHRIRERWMVRRTAVINQIRGLLLERGITIRKGRLHIEASLPAILEDAGNKLSGILRVLLTQLQLEMQYLGRQIDESDKLILEIATGMDSCRRLIAIPGIGPLTATATIAAIDNGAAFKKGRGFAAWLGVVPGEHSTGGKQKLTGTG